MSVLSFLLFGTAFLSVGWVLVVESRRHLLRELRAVYQLLGFFAVIMGLILLIAALLTSLGFCVPR